MEAACRLGPDVAQHFTVSCPRPHLVTVFSGLWTNIILLLADLFWRSGATCHFLVYPCCCRHKHRFQSYYVSAFLLCLSVLCPKFLSHFRVRDDTDKRVVNKCSIQGEESPTSLASEDGMSVRGKDCYRTMKEWSNSSSNYKGEELNINQV